LDKAFRVAAGIVAGALVAVGVAAAGYGTAVSGDVHGAGILIRLAAIAAAMAYGFTRAVGMPAVGIYGTVRDGSEFVMD
jgi:hypothetical protein